MITGIGFIDDRPVAGFSQDFMIAGGPRRGSCPQDLAELMDHAGRSGMPVIGFQRFRRRPYPGRCREPLGLWPSVQPQCAAVRRGTADRGDLRTLRRRCGALSPALMDFVIMTRRSASMFICGPEVIRAVTGQHTTMEEIGSAEAHARVSGNIHFVAEDDRHALDLVRALLFLSAVEQHDGPRTAWTRRSR